jgi:hypothetical protein
MEAFGKSEGSAIAQSVTLGEMLVNAGEQTLRAERDKDGFIVCIGEMLLGDGEIPLTVQVDVRVPLHLRTGIDGPRLTGQRFPLGSI